MLNALVNSTWGSSGSALSQSHQPPSLPTQDVIPAVGCVRGPPIGHGLDVRVAGQVPEGVLEY